MAHKVICPQKKKISRIFKISGTLIVIMGASHREIIIWRDFPGPFRSFPYFTSPTDFLSFDQGVTKRCGLSWLTTAWEPRPLRGNGRRRLRQLSLAGNTGSKKRVQICTPGPRQKECLGSGSRWKSASGMQRTQRKHSRSETHNVSRRCALHQTWLRKTRGNRRKVL